MWRKIEDHPFYTEPREYSKLEAWLDILMQAQHEEGPRPVVFGMKVLQCHYGECLKSNVTWASRWKWSEAKVRRYLKLLVGMGQVSLKNEVVTTRIKVINYEIYDPRRRASDDDATTTRRERDEHSTTDNNDKNDKNVNKRVTLTSNSRCPYQKIATLFHSILPTLPQANLDDNLKKRIRARWKADKQRQSLDWWQWYFTGVADCDFLMGKVKDFSATLHWLTGPENMSKVLNGQYLNRKPMDKNQAAGEAFLEDLNNE